jgi:oligoribonuclease
MKYFAVDIKTTDLVPKEGKILEIGVVFENTETPLPFEECPQLRMVLAHKRVSGLPGYLAMNVRLLDEIQNADDDLAFRSQQYIQYCDQTNLCEPKFAALNLKRFVDKYAKNVPVVFAGKNVGSFDLQFLNRLHDWASYFDRVHTIDPAPLFTNWKEDTRPPSLAVCLERAGLKNEHPHHALHDAWAVVQLFRHYQNSMPS